MRVSILLQITGDDGAIGPAEEVTAFEKAIERRSGLNGCQHCFAFGDREAEVFRTRTSPF